MRSDYGAWLRAQGYDEGTITAQLHRSGRVEKHHGDLERHFAHDTLTGVLDLLRYSTEDHRRGRANPTDIPINGNLRTNLASYRNAVALYRKFLNGEGRAPPQAPSASPGGEGRPAAAEGPSQTRRPTLPRLQSLRPDAVPHEHARTLAEFAFDGQAALAAMIATSRYRTIAQAVASLTVFSHPETVAQTGGKALFPTIRGAPGTFGRLADGQEVMFDDNKSPTDAFLWCNGLSRRGRDTQFNHVYTASGDVDAYTALPNLWMTPAFLAKLTDTSTEVKSLLAYRSWDLYGWKPSGYQVPERGESYASLEWAAPLPAISDLHDRLHARFQKRAKDRTVVAAQRLGWLLS